MKCTAIKTVKNNGKYYRPGMEINLDDKEAKRLEGLGFVKEGYEKPEEEKPEEEKPKKAKVFDKLTGKDKDKE